MTNNLNRMGITIRHIDAAWDKSNSKENNESFYVLAGETKVMVSAPHNVKHLKESVIKPREPYTGMLVILLNSMLGHHAIYKNRMLNDNANYDENCEYKSSLIEYIKNNKVKYLFDFHQMDIARDELVCIGTGLGLNIKNREDLVDKMVNSLEAYGINNITIDYPFNATFRNTVSATIARECGIPCFQIEVNSRIMQNLLYEDSFICFVNALNDVFEIL